MDTHLVTNLYGLPLSPIISVWDIFSDKERGTYVVPFAPSRHFNQSKKDFVLFEFRLYFDLKETESDPSKREGHRFLRKGLRWQDATPVELPAI
jgi:hypothetical protein